MSPSPHPAGDGLVAVVPPRAADRRKGTTRNHDRAASLAIGAAEPAPPPRMPEQLGGAGLRAADPAAPVGPTRLPTIRW